MNTIVRLSDTEKKAQEIASMFEDSNAMHAHAPALFATHAHPRMSQRYAFTNTYEILLHMHNRGFKVTSVLGGTSSYNAVMVRMRNSDYALRSGDKGAPEFVVLDSHDGSKPIKLMLGYIEFACMNGMIAGDIMYARKFRHTAPDLMQQVRLELDDIDNHVRTLTDRVAAMRAYKTTVGEQIALADVAMSERFDNDKLSGDFMVDMRRTLLYVRRPEDKSNDLYTIMNVIQENALRGGVTYVNNNRLQRMRSIGSVTKNLHINQRIWLEAERIMSRALEVEASYDVVEHERS